MLRISRVIFSFTLSWGFTSFLVQVRSLSIELAFFQFFNKIYRFLNDSYYIFLPCIFCVFTFLFYACFCSAAWSCKILSDWNYRQKTFYLLSWCSEIHFFIIELPGMCYFFFTDQTHLGQRQSWQRGRATLDQQMSTNMCHVKMSHIVLSLFSHHKTNPTEPNSTSLPDRPMVPWAHSLGQNA